MKAPDTHIDQYFNSNPNVPLNPGNELWLKLEHRLDSNHYKRKIQYYKFAAIAAVFVTLIAAVGYFQLNSDKNLNMQYQFVIEDLEIKETESDMFFKDVLYLANLENYGDSMVPYEKENSLVE